MIESSTFLEHFPPIRYCDDTFTSSVTVFDIFQQNWITVNCVRGARFFLVWRVINFDVLLGEGENWHFVQFLFLFLWNFSIQRTFESEVPLRKIPQYRDEKMIFLPFVFHKFALSFQTALSWNCSSLFFLQIFFFINKFVSGGTEWVKGRCIFSLLIQLEEYVLTSDSLSRQKMPAQIGPCWKKL